MEVNNWMTNETQDLSAEMTKVLDLTLNELVMLYKSYDGTAMDTGRGTHIEIHSDAGSVRLYSYLKSSTQNLATIYCKLTKENWDEEIKPSEEVEKHEKLWLHSKL